MTPRARRRVVTEVSTAAAAEALGCSVPAFRMWASRQRLTPSRRVTIGRTRYAVWDLDEVLERRALAELRSYERT